MIEPVRLIREDYMLPLSSLRIFFHSLDGSTGLHWHDFYEVFLVVEGSGWHLLNGKTFPLNPGSLFLMTPTDFHEVIPLGETLKLYNLIFTEDCILDDLYDQLFHDLLQERHAVFTDEALTSLQNEFQRLWEEYNRQSIGYRIMLESGLSRILIELLRRLSRANKRDVLVFDTSTHAAVRRALMYMHNHFRDEISLKDAAKQAQLTPNYFSEAFHKATGTPFQTYLQELRLRFAVALLRVSDLSVTDICFASGFNTLSHFLRVFKQKFGQSPNALRQQKPIFKAVCDPACRLCAIPPRAAALDRLTHCQPPLERSKIQA